MAERDNFQPQENYSNNSPFDGIDFSWRAAAEEGKELVEQYAKAFERRMKPYFNSRDKDYRDDSTFPQNT